jgi:MerC mercury resistance protein
MIYSAAYKKDKYCFATRLLFYIFAVRMKLKINWDALGITASLACAIHCALLPLFMTSLPLFGINIIHNYWFEAAMIALAIAIGGYSLYHGYKKHHHSFQPLGLFLAGMGFLVLKTVLHEYELWLLIPAVLLIIAGHVNNYRFCRVHNHAHSDDCNH